MFNKKFSEMTDSEFDRARKMARKEINPFASSKPVKVIENLATDEFYFREQDLITIKRKEADYHRWLIDRFITNTELKEKITKQLADELAVKQAENYEPFISWEKFLETKLFRNP